MIFNSWLFQTGPNCFQQSLLLLIYSSVILLSQQSLCFIHQIHYILMCILPNTQIILSVLAMVINTLILQSQNKWAFHVSYHSGAGCSGSEQQSRFRDKYFDFLENTPLPISYNLLQAAKTFNMMEEKGNYVNKIKHSYSFRPFSPPYTSCPSLPAFQNQKHFQENFLSSLL